ncbi:lamin tail domain-containing protein [Verrucomicrobiaceae bacterium 227]
MKYPLLFLAFAAPLLAVDSVVTFNEIHYNPQGPEEDQEWIELHNQMAINVDLSGWKLTGGVDFTFPQGTTIPGGSTYLIAKNPGNPALSGLNVTGPFTGSLSNSGESLRLRSPSNRLMDEVDYSDSGQWPVGPDGSGATLSKIDSSLLSEKSSSWRTSTQIGGTPGALNFPQTTAPIPHVFVASDAAWRFEDSGSTPPANWNSTNFNDNAWTTGQTLFGTASGGPADLTVTDHLVERFRASDLALSNGQNVTSWPDSATADGESQNATSGGNPTFATNATPSGEPAVRFDGNDQLRTSTSPGIGSTSGFVYFAVVKANSTPGNGGIANGSGPYLWDRDTTATGNPLVSLKSDGGNFAFQKRFDNNSGLGGPISTTAISTSDYQIVAIRRNRTANQFELWVDGAREATEADNGSALTPQPIVIGNHSGGTAGFDGDIAELLIYADELTDAEFESVGAYLESRYGLDTAFPGSAVTTPLAANGSTSYFRQSFTFNGSPNDTSVRLDHLVADGAVVYLNGVEIQRTNMPVGAISHSTKALADVPSPTPSGFLTIPGSSLLNGNNTLAISLHPATGNTTTSFAATLEGTETPPDPGSHPGLALNEVSPAGDVDFFVEITNPGTSPLSTNGYTLVIDGDTTTSIPLPGTTLNPGDLLLLNQATLGVIPTANDKLFLLPPGSATLADAREVTSRLRGLSPAYPGQWIFPNAATPGAANSFALNSGIVINEICYNPPIIDPDPGVPPTINEIPLISSGDLWRYNEQGDSLPADWATQAHPVSGNWESGATTLAYDSGLNIRTLTSPGSNFPSVVTYYFERDFTLTAQQAADLATLTLNHRIDDGAIFYLNGVELDRFQMPAGPVTSSTFASASVGDAAWVGDYVLEIPSGIALTGTNRISVEVHQSTLGSNDIAFDLEARASFLTDPGIPATPARGSDAQWVELHNRSTEAVDLSAWNFGEGIDYTFPAGTTLAAGGYLVISNDPATLAAQHPGITILGPFDGSLSRRSETITLRDQNNNPADSLRYFDGGKWPSKADAGGSTMELIDPRADNALPAAWANSNELNRTSWQNYTFRATAAASAVGPDNQWKEFIFGMLEEGEILIDDLTVTENPDSSAVAMISNGNFESGNLDTWRALGNHQDASIIPDPDGGGNVLYLNATGSTEHMHNHVETTFQGGRSAVNGREYEISFRARWLSGNHLLHTRLYFNRIPHTFQLERPDLLGTPGAPNSTLVPNAGPTSQNLAHSPVVPAPGEAVTISVEASDPDGVEALTLHYRVESGAFATTPMSRLGTTSTWQGNIPGQSAGNAVQFYLTAADTLGATSFIPADGPDSRAMFEVEDGRAASTGCINNFRIIMTPEDLTWMHTPRNLMSNGRLPCTVIDNEGTAYYNTGVRIKGSQRARAQNSRVGFNVGFPSDQLFRNVHRSVAIDRSEGQVVGQREILFDLMATSSGGVPAEFNDLAYVISPNPVHTSAAILQMARFGSVFLDDQFDNGGDGTVYEYELVYYPTTTDAGGYKVSQPDSVIGRDINDMGDNPEDYRWTYLIKNNQEFDDYQPAMALAKQFSKSTTEFNASVADVLDVDQWLRALAYSCATGAGDSFYTNSNHNGQFYGRPDGKVLYFPHDQDFSFNASRGIFENSELNRIVSNPSYRRAYLAHLYDICTTVYNQAWMAPWTAHFDECVPGGNVFSDDLSYINSRSNYILGQINSQVAPINFAITTNGGNNFSTANSPVTLAGTGWVDVHEIRISTGALLDTTWTTTNDWELSFVLGQGVHPVTVEAFDKQGNLIGTDSITITQTGGILLPDASNLVVSEIYYNPPGQDELTEFIELMNIGTSALDLAVTSFTEGITFTFPADSTLAPGQRIVIVKDLTGFQTQFGNGINIGGVFEGSLANSGELIVLKQPGGTIIQSFTYSDSAPWPLEADGDGYTLVLVVPECAPDHNLAINWQASLQIGGSPGSDDAPDYLAWKATYGNPADNADPDGDGWSVLEEFFFGGTPDAKDNLAPIYQFDPASQTITASVTRRAGLAAKFTFQSSTDLKTWATDTAANVISNQRPPLSPDVEVLTYAIPISEQEAYYRFHVELP